MVRRKLVYEDRCDTGNQDRCNRRDIRDICEMRSCHGSIETEEHCCRDDRNELRVAVLDGLDFLIVRL